MVFSDRAWTVNPASLIRVRTSECRSRCHLVPSTDVIDSFPQVGSTQVAQPQTTAVSRPGEPSQAVSQASPAGGDTVSKTSSASGDASKPGGDSSPAAPSGISGNQTMDRELGVSCVLLDALLSCDHHVTVTCSSHDSHMTFTSPLLPLSFICFMKVMWSVCWMTLQK